MKAKIAFIALALAASMPAWAEQSKDPIGDLAQATGLSERKVQMIVGNRTAFAEYPYTYDRALKKFVGAIGEVRSVGNRERSASETWRALALFGSTLASTPVKRIPVNGIPRAMRSAAVAAATSNARRMTACESRYQKPPLSARSLRSPARLSRAGASAFTRGPRSARIAGSTTSALTAESSATKMPPIPIE